ncbi:MAG: hypothetical protein ACTSR3_02410 [Candidatus Helarchaeota archaeon]
MSKKSSIAFFIAITILGSYFIFNVFQFNNFGLIPGLDLIPNHYTPPISDIRISDSLAPNITNWKFNGTPFSLADLLTEKFNESANITVTVTDDSMVKNVTLWFDTELTDHAGPQSIEMVPDRDNQTLHAEESNKTINGITQSYSNVINNVTATNTTGDGNYQIFANGTNGILVAYSINLSNYINMTLNYSHIYFVNISIRAFINNTSGVTWAGWQIWNNNTKQLDIIDGTFLNSTQNVTAFTTLYGDNLTDYYDQTNNSRIEIFINITSSNPVSVSVDYIGFDVSYSSNNYTATMPNLPWERIAWDGSQYIYKRDIVEFWVVAYDISGNSTTTVSTKYNYSIIDEIKPEYNISVHNESYVGGVARIEIRALDFGSGVGKITLQIDGNLTSERTWDDINEFKAQDPYLQNISVYYDWNVTDFLDYNGTSGNNATHIINITVWDRQGNVNSTNNWTIFIDNEDPYGSYLNLRTNDMLEINATCKENRTITHTILNATDFVNSVSATYELDNSSHGYSNDTSGILMAYAVELADYNLSILDNIYSVNVSIVAKINTTTGVTWAGWQVWNWTKNALQDINATVFNSTSEVAAWFMITRENASDFIDENNNSRIEFFINVTCSNPVNASVNFIGYYIKYFKTLDVYSDHVVNTNLSVRFRGFDNWWIDKFVLYANNEQVFLWQNQSGTFNNTIKIDDFYYYHFNSSDLPNGTLTLKLTVFDMAGNINYTTFSTKIDNMGPDINFTSLENNSVFSSSGSWNFIVPITFFANDEITSLQRVELYINGTIGEVLPGQNGQIIDYDEFGNIIYVQQNATWYKDGTYTYYWNASTYTTGSVHNLTLCAFDIVGNSANYSIFVRKTNYSASVSIEFVSLSGVLYVQNWLYFSFKVTNTGNCTLFDFDLSLHFYFLNKTLIGVEIGWISIIQLGDSGKNTWLLPGESMTVEFLVYGLEYYSPGFFEVFLNVDANAVETFLYSSEDFHFEQNKLYLSYSAPYETQFEGMLPYIIVFLSAFGSGVLLHILIRRIQIRYRKMEEVYAEKIKKTKEKTK